MTDNADYSILSVTHTASSTFNSPRVPPSRVMMPPTPVMYLRAHSAPPFNLRDDFHFPGSTSPADHESRSTTVPQRFIRTTFSASSTPISSLLELQEEQPRHIPRPPNAFMLYRSDFLKRRAIPEEIERRQQNLSRIAGQCWRMLSAEEKAVWNNKAAEVAAAHHAKYPDYKFRPVRKGAKKQTGKKIDKPLKSGASRGRGSGKLTRESDIVESSIGPARRPCRSHARPSPYDGGLSASLQLPITPSMTVSPSASPPSLNPLLYPIAPFDGSAGAAAFDNTSQVQIPHCQDILSLAPTLSQYSVFSSGKTPADIIQDLTLAPILENHAGFLYDHNPACFGGEKNQMHGVLHPDSAFLSSELTASTLIPREDGINLLTPENLDHSNFKLNPFHTSLLSWLPDGTDNSSS